MKRFIQLNEIFQSNEHKMLIYFVFLELVSLFGVQKNYKLNPFYLLSNLTLVIFIIIALEMPISFLS